jgi:AcrR family transcriptional regulator
MNPMAKRTQVDRRAETQTVLIQSAIDLLTSVGFAGATTQLIAQRAGVTTGALHHHFPTKGELMFAVLDRASSQLQERLEGEAGDTLNEPSQVRALVDHLWQVYGHPEYWAVWEIIIGTRADPMLHDRVVKHRVETLQTVLHPWLTRLEVAPEMREEVVATFEFALIAIRGLGLERFLDKSAAYFDRNLSILAEYLDFRLQTIWGLGPAPAQAAKG